MQCRSTRASDHRAMVVIVAMKLGGEGGILKRGPADQRVGMGKHSQLGRRPRPSL